MRVAVFAAAAFLLAGLAQAQDAPADPPAPQTLADLDSAIAAISAKNDGAGLSVAVVENGEVVLTKGYGLADRGAKTPVTPDTVFRAGSISKTFVALTVLQLVNDGKFTLDTRLAEIAPEIGFRNPWEATDPVRVSHLLEHTTGWADLTLGDYAHGAPGEALIEPLRLNAPSRISRYKPGLFFSYANQGYGILGYLVEKTDGRPFADAVRARVLAPLGMNSSDFTLTEALQPRLAKSYTRATFAEEPYTSIGMTPAGHLHATAPDLAKLVQMFLARGGTTAPEATVARMERSDTSLLGRSGASGFAGAGLFQDPSKTHVFVGHDGGIDGFAATFAYLPGTGRGYVILSNATGAGLRDALRAVQGYLTRDLPVSPPPPAALSPARAAELGGFYTVTPGRNGIVAFPEQATVLWTGLSEAGELTALGTTYVPMSDALFRTKERAVPTLAVVTDGGTRYIVSSDGNLRQLAMPEAAEKIAFLAVSALALLLAAIYLPIWAAIGLRGGLRTNGGVLLRLLPVLGVAAFIALLVLLFRTLNGPASEVIDALGNPGPIPYVLMGLSALVPVFAALSLVQAFAARGASGFGRFQAAFIGLALAWISVRMAQTGWLPFQSWTL